MPVSSHTWSYRDKLLVKASWQPDLPTSKQQPDTKNKLIMDEGEKGGHAQARVDQIDQNSPGGEDTEVGYQINRDVYPELLSAFGYGAKCVGHIFWVKRGACIESTEGASKEDKEKQKSTQLADAYL